MISWVSECSGMVCHQTFCVSCPCVSTCSCMDAASSISKPLDAKRNLLLPYHIEVIRIVLHCRAPRPK